jgi:prefoldin subunit 5
MTLFSTTPGENGHPVIADTPVNNYWYNIAVASDQPISPLPDSLNLDLLGEVFSPDGKTPQENYIEKLHAHIQELDDAQKNVEQLQIQLQSFNKELSDVKFRDNLGAGMGRLLRFSDTYFENLLTVETPVERLKESIRQVDETRDLILGMLRQLQSRLEEVRHRQVTMQKELNRLIVATEL